MGIISLLFRFGSQRLRKTTFSDPLFFLLCLPWLGEDIVDIRYFQDFLGGKINMMIRGEEDALDDSHGSRNHAEKLFLDRFCRYLGSLEFGLSKIFTEKEVSFRWDPKKFAFFSSLRPRSLELLVALNHDLDEFTPWIYLLIKKSLNADPPLKHVALRQLLPFTVSTQKQERERVLFAPLDIFMYFSCLPLHLLTFAYLFLFLIMR